MTGMPESPLSDLDICVRYPAFSDAVLALSQRLSALEARQVREFLGGAQSVPGRVTMTFTTLEKDSA